MAENITFNLDLENNQQNQRTVGELREEFTRLEEAVDNTRQGTEEYRKAVQQLGQVQGELEKVDRAIEAMNPERKAQVIGDAVAGMTGGFQAAIASAELFGIENENVLESLNRVNQVMAITDGITAFSEKIPAMKTLIATMPRLTSALKGARVGFQGLSAATKALGIGLLVSAVALLVTHWEDIQEVITDLIPGVDNLSGVFGKLTSAAKAVGSAILQYLSTPLKAVIQIMQGDFSAAKDTIVNGFDVIGNASQAYAESEKARAEELRKKRIEEELKTAERQLEILRARGADTTALEQRIFDMKKDLYEEDSQEYKDLIHEQNLADAERTRRQQEELQKRAELRRQAREALAEARRGATGRGEDEILDEEISFGETEGEEQQELIFVNGKVMPMDMFQAMVDTGQIAKLDAIDAELALVEEGTAEYIRLEKQRADAAKDIAEAEADAKVETFERTGQALGQLARLAGEQTIIGKALGVAQATIDTYVGANKALAQGGIFGIVSAATVIATGLANVRQILSTKVPSIQGQPLGTPAASPLGGGGASRPAPTPPEFNESGIQTVNQVNNGQNQNQPQQIRAYVVESELTRTQRRVSEIEEEATF